MTTGWATATLVAATITNGLMAGLFAAYSYAVMPGLGRTGDRTFVEAMQQTNAAILNGWFGLCFGGAVLFAAAAVLLHLGRPGLPWLVAGLVPYGAGAAWVRGGGGAVRGGAGRDVPGERAAQRRPRRRGSRSRRGAGGVRRD